ncbi:MAG: hypothetical protein WCQ47_06410 [bacterium]
MSVKKAKKTIKNKVKTKKDMALELDKLKERIMSTSWHHMQTESSVKQLFFELIDILKKNK